MPPKYEYKTVDTLNPNFSDSETLLNSCGNDGWELVSAYCWVLQGINRHQFYFKRELQQEPQVDETEVTLKYPKPLPSLPRTPSFLR